MTRLTLETFLASIDDPTPPAGLSPILLALWHDGHGDWEEAHNVAQDVHTEMGSRIHAYLHRKEGDESNAAYWYRRADVPIERGSLDQEWRTLVKAALSDSPGS